MATGLPGYQKYDSAALPHGSRDLEGDDAKFPNSVTIDDTYCKLGRLNTGTPFSVGTIGMQLLQRRRGAKFLAIWMMTVLSPLVFGADPTPSPEVLGQQLAAEIRQQRPVHGSTNSATLRLREKSGRRTSVPVQIETQLTENGWKLRYKAIGERPGGVSHAVIVQTLGATPSYEIQSPSGLVQQSGLDQANLSLAGSDFWISDLALEFLHWPQQRVVRQEVSSARMCHVLESTHPTPGTNGYSKVISWVDTKFLAILNAEAFDQTGKLLKRFSTGSFRKFIRTDGQEAWFLQDVKIANHSRNSVTELNFEVPEK